MKIVIPGGTGQVGTLLARAFTADGHNVTVLSRNPGLYEWETVRWDGRTPGDWTDTLEGADVVINLVPGAASTADTIKRTETSL